MQMSVYNTQVCESWFTVCKPILPPSLQLYVLKLSQPSVNIRNSDARKVLIQRAFGANVFKMAYLAVLFSMLALVSATTPLSPNALTFGSAGKAITLGPGETELFTHECSSAMTNDESVCILRHMWFGGSWARYDITRLRVYVDSEASPSIDGQMDLLHGIGFADDAAPWSSGSLFGKTGSPSGIFNTFKIPFAKSIRVTAQAYTNASSPSKKGERFWWIMRGTEGEPGVELGGKLLPLAARIKLYTNENVSQVCFVITYMCVQVQKGSPTPSIVLL